MSISDDVDVQHVVVADRRRVDLVPQVMVATASPSIRNSMNGVVGRLVATAAGRRPGPARR